MTIRLRSPRTDLAWTRQGDPDGPVTQPRVTQPCEGCGTWVKWCGYYGACFEQTRHDMTRPPHTKHNRSPWNEQNTIEAIQKWVAKTGELPTTYMWMRQNKHHPGAGRVAVLFGTWNNAIQAAGYTPNRNRW